MLNEMCKSAFNSVVKMQAICEELPKDRNPPVDLLNLFNYANSNIDEALKKSSSGEMNQVNPIKLACYLIGKYLHVL